MQVSKGRQTEEEESGSEDVGHAWVPAWKSEAGGGRRNEAAGEHSRPHPVQGTKKRRPRGWHCETPQPHLTLDPGIPGTNAMRLCNPYLL